jgi:alkanesulfonate monooxygenase SsuD/methylene tetrahydromethanopterin reductase-like flavin-dependent oxidoreductase (luciferase family)
MSLAERAETLGFDSIWVGDSITARPRFEPLTTLAAVATRTRRVKLGTAVLTPALRQPVVLANEIANVDHIAEGRLILGMGIGGKAPANASEFAACGIPMGQRVGLYDEGLTLMRRLWSEPEVTFSGRYLKVDNVRPGFPPFQKGGPPYWLAAGADSAFRRLLRLGDGWFPISPTPDAFAASWQRIQEIGKEVGRDAGTLHRCLYTTLNVNSDRDRAEAELRGFIEGYYATAYEGVATATGVYPGTPEQCAARLNAFIAAGAQSIVIRFGAPDQEAQLECWVRDVLPLVVLENSR